MIICSSSNIDLIQGVSGYGTVSDGATDWRIENTATGVFNILNSPNLLTPNVSIIDAGNIGIGTIPVTGTNKLQVQGNLNVSGGYFVAGVAFKPATAVLADTATALATSRNIAGVGFTGASAIDIPYFNLTNKITAGNGISLTAGSAAASPVISTNLTAGNGISISAAASPVITANITAGTNITFTGTNPISISAAGGTASQWTGNVGANIYYNSGNVGIGTATVNNILQVGNGDRLRISNGTSDNSVIGTGETEGTNTRITLFGGTHPSAAGQISYVSKSTGSHVFFTTESNAERMRITSTGNVGIGTNAPRMRLDLCTADSASIQNLIDFRNTANYGVYLTSSSTGNSGNSLDFRSNDYNGGSITNRELMFVKAAGVIFPNGFTNNSDSRIKKDIEDINDATALNKLLLIQPSTYDYIEDYRNKGFGKVYGFIAQQIREVIPEAIIIIEEYIPNIYKSCLINNKREVYHKIPLDTPVDTSIKIDDALYKIKEIYEDYFVIDNDIDVDEAFVFGYSVDDFHTLNKDYIFTLNVCATQELHRRIETQSVLLKSQDDRIKDLETKVATLMSNSNAT